MAWKTIREDIQAVFNKDPAARTWFEVLTCYPGLHAIWLHRIAHFLWKRGFVWLPRFISHLSRFFTGIEIHPGATIGRRFFIDHGMGVVIGETAEIGDDCLLYQGVVLGGTSLEKKKRHPTLGNGVTIGSGAIVLGAITLGDGSKVGGGSVIVHSIPPGATAVGVPGRIVGAGPKKRKETLMHGDIPDPVAEAIRFWARQQNVLEEKMADLYSKMEKMEKQPRKKEAFEDNEDLKEEVKTSKKK